MRGAGCGLQDAGGVDLVHLDVSVLDRDRRPVRGQDLPAATFNAERIC